MTDDLPPVIVGAGPAGARAAIDLAWNRLRPIVIDEAPANGGQIYRRPPPGFTRPAKALYGFEAAKARAIHRDFAEVMACIDYRPNTLVWSIRPGVLYTLQDGRNVEVKFRDLILATGAMDRVIPIPGWTLPGVFTLGGAQVALKAQGCAIGRRVAFVGAGPLLWLVAYQYLKAGAAVAAVIDTTPFATKVRQTRGLLRMPSAFAKGLWYVARVRAAGVRCAEGAAPVAIDGDARVAALRWRDGFGIEHRVDCDAVAIGFGLKPETQLADLAELALRFNALQRVWEVERDSHGRSSVKGIYVAGDGAGIAGADMAELSGHLAARAALLDRGIIVERPPSTRVRERRINWEYQAERLQLFRDALDAAFPFPAELAATVAGDTIVCRCEAITADELRRSARDGAPEVNRAKAFSRVGMGRCQGRVCGPAAAEILARELGIDIAAVGRLRGQPPVKPVPMSIAE